MAYRISGPEASSRGRGRGRGFLPHGRRQSALRSAQGVYPICADDDAAVAFVKFIHNQGSQILQATGGPWAPQLYASLIESARDHISSIARRKESFARTTNPISMGQRSATSLASQSDSWPSTRFWTQLVVRNLCPPEITKANFTRTMVRDA